MDVEVRSTDAALPALRSKRRQVHDLDDPSAGGIASAANAAKFSLFGSGSTAAAQAREDAVDVRRGAPIVIRCQGGAHHLFVPTQVPDLERRKGLKDKADASVNHKTARMFHTESYDAAAL